MSINHKAIIFINCTTKYPLNALPYTRRRESILPEQVQEVISSNLKQLFMW